MQEDALLVLRRDQYRVTSPKPSRFTLHAIAAVLFRRRRVMALAFLGVLTGVGLALWLIPDQYEAEMKMLVKRERFDPVVTATSVSDSAQQPQLQPLSQQDVNSEVDLIQSHDLLRQVVIENKLQDRIPWYRRLLPRQDEETRIGKAIQSLQKNLSVEPPNQSNVMTVKFDIEDRELAAKVLMSLSAVYLRRHREVNRPPGQYEFFQKEVANYRKQLDDAQVKMASFSRKEGVIAADQEQQNLLNRMAQFDTDLKQTQAAMAADNQRIAQLRELQIKFKSRRTTTVTTSYLLLEQLKQTLANLELQRTALLQKYEPTYRPVQELEQQIAEAKTAIAKAEAQPTAQTTTDVDPTSDWIVSEMAKTKADLATLQAKAAATAGQLKAYQAQALHLEQKGIEQRDLINDVNVAQASYLDAVKRQDEARMSDALDRHNIVNVTLAETPQAPELPTISFLSKVILGVFLAFMVSIGAAFVSDYLDPTFRTPQEVEALLGVPVVAAIPEHWAWPLLVAARAGMDSHVLDAASEDSAA